MDKDALKKVLLSEGLLEERDELFDDNVTVRDWVSRHEDLVRSNRAIAQAVQADAPHDVKEGYFKDKDEQRQYDAGEKKYNEELAKKQQLAEEYKRSQDDSYFNTEIGPFQLANEYARKQHIKGNDKLAALNEAAAKAAFATDFAPFPVSLIGPTIRYAQRAGNEDEWVPDAATIADFGTSLLGPAKGAAKAGYEGVKRAAGPLVGRLFETKLGKNIEKGLGALDARSDAKDLFKARTNEMYKVNEFARKYEKGQLNELEVLDFADMVEDEYPQLAKALRSKVNLDASQREAERLAKEWTARAENSRKAAAQTADKNFSADLHKSAAMDSEEALKHEANALIAERKLPEAAEHANIELNEAKQMSKDKFMHQNVLPTAEGNLHQPVYDIDKAYKRYKATTAASPMMGRIVQAASKPATKAGIIRTYNDNTDYKQYEKDYNQAIEYIIQSNKRQWNAGFKPRDGIELEAWQIAKDRGEI